MNLASLPDIAFCETDTAAVERQIIADYERIAEVSLYPGDPVRLFLEGLAYLISQQRFMIDYAGKMNMVSKSEAGFLDHLGALLNTVRLGSGYAQTTLRYTLAEALDWPTVIPQGTRATADGQMFWATTTDAVIEAGQTTVDVQAQCAEPGAQGNGLVPGQINHMVDRITYVSTVENLTLTLGGTDDESDERYRGRVQLAPERLSVCGPEGAYRFWAMSVSQDILDVAVWSPESGQVKLAPLMVGGKLPPDEIIKKVAAAVLPSDHRPLTDVVQVVQPEPISYQVHATYYIRTSYANKGASIQAQAQKALAGWQAWQCSKLGRDITPSELTARIQSIDGVQRVEINEPAYQALDKWQVAQADQAVLNYGGLSDDD
jgi:phage-related baseplate assembly protein